MWTKFFSICLIAVMAQAHISVVGPRVSKNGDTYKTIVTASESNKTQEMAIYLNCNGKIARQKFSSEQLKGFKQEVELKLNNPMAFGECEFGTVVREEGTDFCFADNLKVINSADTFVMIQTDKPIYKPNDRLHYQIIALDGTTKPIELKSAKVDVYDAKDNLVITNDIKLTAITKPKFGFHQDELNIRGDPNFGTWTIKVRINGQNLITEKSFVVQESTSQKDTSAPFKIQIDAFEQISFFKNELKFKVLAFDFLDKPAKGKVTIKATSYFGMTLIPGHVNKEFKVPVEQDGKTNVIKINFKEDFKYEIIGAVFSIDLDVEFEEERTDIKVKASKKVLLLPHSEHKIEVHGPNTFQPYSNYTLKVIVKHLDGELEMSKTRKVYGEFTLGTEAPLINGVNLKNGVGIFSIYTKNSKVMKYRFGMDYELNDGKLAGGLTFVKSSSNEDDFIILSMLNEEPTTGQDLDLTVETNTKPKTLTIIVMTGRRIAYKKHFDGFNSIKNVSIPITAEMAPQADVIAYYLKNGSPVSDQLRININMEGGNSLKITPPKNQLDSKSSVTINADTEKNSLVALIAAEENGIKNLITQSAFEDTFRTLLPEPDKQDQIIKNTNAYILMPNKKPKQTCTEFQTNLFGGKIEDLSNDISGTNQGFSSSNAQKDLIVRTYFPNVWFSEVIETKDGNFSIKKIALDTTNTWILNGFSINEEKGFAVAKPLKIQVVSDFFIKIDKAQPSKLNEIMEINVVVYNYMTHKVGATIEITKIDDQFDFINSDNQVTGANSKILETDVDKEGGMSTVFFKIKPKKLDVLLDIEAKAEKTCD